MFVLNRYDKDGMCECLLDFASEVEAYVAADTLNQIIEDPVMSDSRYTYRVEDIGR